MPSHSSCPAASGEGFTLLELIVVITIIGIMATMVVVNTTETGPQARRMKIVSDADSIMRVAASAYSQTGRYPDSIEEMVRGVDAAGRRFMMKLDTEPLDPWTKPYVYEVRDDGPVVICLGSDGRVGGEGEAADIVRPVRTDPY